MQRPSSKEGGGRPPQRPSSREASGSKQRSPDRPASREAGGGGKPQRGPDRPSSREGAKRQGSKERRSFGEGGRKTFEASPHDDDDADGDEEEEAEEAEEAEVDWLLVLGGLDGPTVHRSTELFDHRMQQSIPGPELGTQRWGCAAIALGTRVLVIGGSDGRGYLDTTEIIDVKEWTCTPGPRLGTPRAGCSVVRVDQTRALVIGGYSLDTCEVLDLAALSFKSGPRLRSARACCAAVMLDEHRLLVAGGYDRLGCCSSSEILDLRKAPRENEWDDSSPPSLEKARFLPGPSLAMPRGGLTASKLVGGGRVIFVGGFDGKYRLDSTEFLDLGNYQISCSFRNPAVGDVVAEKDMEDVQTKPYSAPPPPPLVLPGGSQQLPTRPQEEDDDSDDDEEARMLRPKWKLHGGVQATVVDVVLELDPEYPLEDWRADSMTFRLRNPEGQESMWLPIEDWAYPPTNVMTWATGPDLTDCRSGSVSVIFPARSLGESRPRLVVLGGLGETPNQAIDSAEVLDGRGRGEFAMSASSMAERRAYFAAVVVTVVGKLGPPQRADPELSFAIALVSQQLAEPKELAALSAGLEGLAKNSEQLRSILQAHGWEGADFAGAEPDLARLLRALKQARKAQASGKKK